MSGRAEPQAKASSTSQPSPANYRRSRPFADSQTPSQSPEPEILQTQLDGANPCNYSFSRVQVNDSPPAVIQPKLTVGQPGDQYEQEADQMAAQVISMTAPPINPSQKQHQDSEEFTQRKPLAAAITPIAQGHIQEVTLAEPQPLHPLLGSLVQREELSEEDEESTSPALLQRAVASESGSDPSSQIESQLNQSKGGGSPLSAAVRSFMEPRFGNDFSQVRVHTDSAAVQMNQDLHAQAFTHGSDIYFGTGKYQPESTEGKQLLAHELTHVVQQTGAVQPRTIMRQDLDGGVATAPPQPTDAGPVAGVPTDATADPNAIPEDLQQFRDHGAYPGDALGQTITPETGLGGFNARYDPVSMTLAITVNIAMTFVDGITLNGNRFVANDPGLQPLVDRANRTRGAARQQLIQRVQDNWQWHGQEDAWMQTYKQSVADAWSKRFTFQSTKSGWQAQLANVQVVINTWKDVATGGASGATAPPAGAVQPVHCHARILKTRDDNTSVNAEVGGGDAANATDQTLTLGSGQAITTAQNLTTTIWFPSGTAALQPAQRDTLRRFIISYQAPTGGSGSSIDITGHANTTGGNPERNQKISEDRANAVAEFLRTTTVEGKTLANAATRIRSVTGAGTTGATESPDWRRVDIVVAGGQGQNTAAHEFGHMIGLGDEYATTPKHDSHGNPVTDPTGRHISRGLITGTGGEVGDATTHNDLSQRMGLGGSVAENNDSMMSLGNTIRPQHYATFMQALRNVTGMTEWGLKS
jgi:outer membrane protein OmpA-like peptidoglycan-associated protein